jgi:hypothetical protein
MVKRLIPLLALSLCLLPVPCLAQGPDEVLVRGQLIDVRYAFPKQDFYPQFEWKCSPELISVVGKGAAFAVSLMENRGPVQICCGRSARARIALDTDEGVPAPWTATGETFEAAGIQYWVYENRKIRTGEWTEIPYPEYCSRSAVVLGERITVDGVPDFGTVIAKIPTLRKGGVYNETITMLPDGSYLAACTGTGDEPGPTMYISQDKGATWSRHGDYSGRKNGVMNYHNLFVLDGAVYFMGVGAERDGLRICRSDDGGRTWTVARDSHSGLILEGQYHTAPVPVLISGGRIWRACETYPAKQPFVVSAPLGCDLLEASNWTRTNTVGSGSHNIQGYRMSGSLIEGNVVEAPSGEVINLIRTNSSATSRFAYLLHVMAPDSLSFDPERDWVEMPGGGKKFTVRYDPVSGRYWALTNPDSGSPEKFYHRGITGDGLSRSLERNRLVLVCSTDLVNWMEVATVLYDPDPFFHGFQYADWVFDGDDIAAVVRVGAPESRGLPVRQHDSNMMCFVRIASFRDL